MGKALKLLREARRLRLHEFAARSGVRLGTLARTEQGGGRATPAPIDRAAAAWIRQPTTVPLRRT